MVAARSALCGVVGSDCARARRRLGILALAELEREEPLRGVEGVAAPAAIATCESELEPGRKPRLLREAGAESVLASFELVGAVVDASSFVGSRSALLVLAWRLALRGDPMGGEAVKTSCVGVGIAPNLREPAVTP